jgi:hypothetical protein
MNVLETPADGRDGVRLAIGRRSASMMRASLSAAFLFAAIVPGCSSRSVNLPPAPPHGGIAFTLPEGKGFVEVLRQEVPEQPGRTRLVAYFLDAACKPVLSALTAVSFTPKGRGAAPGAFKPIGDADLAKAGAMASVPFPDPGEIVGLLSATIENKPVSVAINLR